MGCSVSWQRLEVCSLGCKGCALRRRVLMLFLPCQLAFGGHPFCHSVRLVEPDPMFVVNSPTPVCKPLALQELVVQVLQVDSTAGASDGQQFPTRASLCGSRFSSWSPCSSVVAPTGFQRRTYVLAEAPGRQIQARAVSSFPGTSRAVEGLLYIVFFPCSGV